MTTDGADRSNRGPGQVPQWTGGALRGSWFLRRLGTPEHVLQSRFWVLLTALSSITRRSSTRLQKSTLICEYPVYTIET